MAIRTPHSEQNFAETDAAVPQRGQRCARGVAHCSQNLASGRFWCRQLGHHICVTRLSYGDIRFSVSPALSGDKERTRLGAKIVVGRRRIGVLQSQSGLIRPETVQMTKWRPPLSRPPARQCRQPWRARYDPVHNWTSFWPRCLAPKAVRHARVRAIPDCKYDSTHNQIVRLDHDERWRVNDPIHVGRFLIKNFCVPSSTSSRRWLCTVERSVTTPVVRPGVSSTTSSAGS